MSDTNKKLTDRFWAAFESGDFEAIASHLDSDIHWKMPGVEMRGSAPLLEMLRAYRVAFPDLRHEVQSWVENDDTIAIELVVRGTHQGPMQTPKGVVQATGKSVVWDSCDYIKTRNGKIVSWHVFHDTIPFLTALGLTA